MYATKSANTLKVVARVLTPSSSFSASSGSSSREASAVARRSLSTISAGSSTASSSRANRQPNAVASDLSNSSTRNVSSTASQQMATPVEVAKPTTRAGLGSAQGPGKNLLNEIMDTLPRHSTANRAIYLDAQATTPLDPRVLDAMMPFMTNQYGNPHSRTHAYGWESEEAVEESRKHIASLIGADAKEIIFTSGATETNNMALKGVAHFYGAKKNHIITTQTEHKCVLDSARRLQEEGFEVTYLPVQRNGLVDLKDLEAALRPTTAIVSIMTVNNEIGVIQPMKEIGHLLKTKGAELAKSAGLSGKPLFHTDAAQAAGKIELDVDDMGIDLMSLSSHKLYGPKGIGAAYIRRRPRVRLSPLINGGGQERGLRSGTLAPALVVGFGEAARLAKQELWYDHAHVSRLAERLRNNVTANITHVLFNGDAEGYPGCLNISFEYIEGESLLMALKDVCLSSGSACTSASLEPSYVLRALGLNDENAHSSLRFGISRFTTESEVDYVTEKIIKVVHKLREMSPLWEMVQEGIDLSKIEWSGH